MTYEFLIFLVVSEPVSEKIGTGKKSRNSLEIFGV